MTHFKSIVVLTMLAAAPVFAQKKVEKIRKAFLDPKSKMVLVASHRAVHHQYPENSILAIKEAIRLGIDIVEIDVQVSKDGIPMLMHDGKIDRTTNGKGDLEEQNYEDLRKLRLVANGKITDEVIPTLEEALIAAKGNILVDLDLKTDHIRQVINVVKKTKSGKHVFFFDSNYAMLSQVDSASKDFMLMPRAYNYAMADSALKLYGPEVVHIDSKFYTDEVCSLIKNKGARIWINALGKPDVAIRDGKEKEALEELLKHGANIIQTDEPEKLMKALQKNGLHW
jgi:glycerophosphoryl diester phosphodiesterase